MSGYTVFLTYALQSTGGTLYNNTGVHCNYIQSLHLDTIINKEVNIFFGSVDDFKFLSTSGGTGYTANNVWVILQLVDNSGYTDPSEIKPQADLWKYYDVTYQIQNMVGVNISKYNMGETLFKVPLNDYDTYPTYNLEYLNYPNITQEDSLSFGDEEIFMGNVTTDVEAIAYMTDLSINLDLNEFNTSTNKTWDGETSVYITEVGLYNQNKELVAIGKFNNPIPKDDTTSRTILFGLDF